MAPPSRLTNKQDAIWGTCNRARRACSRGASKPYYTSYSKGVFDTIYLRPAYKNAQETKTECGYKKSDGCMEDTQETKTRSTSTFPAY